MALNSSERHGGIITQANYPYEGEGYINNGNSSKNKVQFVLETVAVVRVVFYFIILVVSIFGNVLVIVTLCLNRRMKNIINVFLLNLSISALFIVFCTPFTLVGSLLGTFIFWETTCQIIPFFQATSVSVSAWTLVAISIDRFYAICRPSRSRPWQTLCHARKVICIIWLLSLLNTLPIPIHSKLLPIVNQEGKFRCMEVWSSFASEIGYNIYLDTSTLIIPLIIMMIAYTLLIRAVSVSGGINTQGEECGHDIFHLDKIINYSSLETVARSSPDSGRDRRRSRLNRRINQNYKNQSRMAKRKVILMLFVLVVTFFVCWMPLYFTYTWHIYSLDTTTQYRSTVFSVLQLIAFASTCLNPIIYCFMHQKLREASLSAMKCDWKRRWQPSNWQPSRRRPIRRGNRHSGCSPKTLSVEMELQNMKL